MGRLGGSERLGGLGDLGNLGSLGAMGGTDYIISVVNQSECQLTMEHSI
jgi:hypothetical protein